jgi:hypothetical protein
MQNANLPPNLTIDELIQHQVDHARKLGVSEQEISSLLPFQKWLAKMVEREAPGLEAFRSITEFAIETDFGGLPHGSPSTNDKGEQGA